MNTQFFTLDGESSEYYGITMQSAPVFSAPKPRVETVSVSGRNGDLIFYDGSYENIEGTLRCYILHEQSFDVLADANKWLCKKGYRRFAYDGDEFSYRMVRIVNGAECAVRMKILDPFEITLDCKPQKFLVSGDNPITFTSSGGLYSPAVGGLPLLKVYGTGSLWINDTEIEVLDSDGWVMIDCETQNAYKGMTNCNSDISCDEFPILVSGQNSIEFDNTITKVELTPRWYVL